MTEISNRQLHPPETPTKPVNMKTSAATGRYYAKEKINLTQGAKNEEI